MKYQPQITTDLPQNALYLCFKLRRYRGVEVALHAIQEIYDKDTMVIGFSSKVLRGLNVDSPDGDYDMVIWLKDDDRGELLLKALKFQKTVDKSFRLDRVITAHTHNVNKDLSGFEDGTENPSGADIETTAICAESQSSFWVVQQWQHDFDKLFSMDKSAKERAMGRSLDDNHEFADNLPTAHTVKTAQHDETDTMWRRSMPYSNNNLEGGLVFSSFNTSFEPFLLHLKSMQDEKCKDGVFKFSKIKNTSYLIVPAIGDDDKLQLEI